MTHDHELLPAPAKRIPALTLREQRAHALTILIQYSAGPGHVALRAARDDALRIATGRECNTHHVRLPRRGDTRMSCLRCSWSRTLTAEDVDRELATLASHLSLAQEGAA